MTTDTMPALISAAVAAKMTPEFIEKEIDSRVGQLVVQSIDRALSRYSDTGKLIEAAVGDALKVERLDLPSYGAVVTQMVKAQIEARVSEVVAGRLAADIEELLKLAPKEIKLSEIADQMRERHQDAHGEGWGEIITVLLEDSSVSGSSLRWLYLDEDKHYREREKHSCQFSMLIDADGKIACARLSQKNLDDHRWIGRNHGLAQHIRAWHASGTRIILDEDAVVVSVGDF
ncbi:hypothetical protein BH10PSE14_BH10PSE14_06310 [soil metagenome]